MSDVKWVSVPSSFIFSDELRLDAEFYSKERLKAQILIEELKKKKIPVTTIQDETFVKDIFWPGRFKRKYVSPKEGKPFLTPKEVFTFKISPRKFVTGYPDSVKIEKNWILITRSGSVGRVIISNSLLSEFVLSDDIIRVIPQLKSNFGYLYAYLNTWIGQAFLTKTNYGGPIKHIEPHHVANIPFPLVDEDIMKKVNSMILEAHKMREEAQLKLLEAEKLFYAELGLPEIDEDSVEYFRGDLGRKVKAFTVKASELDLRLDASYHIPISRKIQEEITKTGMAEKLRNIVTQIFIPSRFKRIYVKKGDEGIPFLQGSHLPLVKFFDVKYLWKKSPNIESLLIKSGWILMTRSGTVGNIALATKSIENWAASEHVIRIVPKDNLNPGYLWAALTSIYGQIQIKAKIYGGVVDEIAEKDTSLLESILLPLPDKSTQDKIGNLVIEAYELKDKANLLEQEAVSMLERHLEELSGVSL